MSRISLMAAVDKGRLSKKSLHSYNLENKSNILENVFSLSRDPTTLSFGAGNNGNNNKCHINADGRADTGRFKAS